MKTPELTIIVPGINPQNWVRLYDSVKTPMVDADPIWKRRKFNNINKWIKQ